MTANIIIFRIATESTHKNVTNVIEQIAYDEINNDTNILPNYKLQTEIFEVSTRSEIERKLKEYSISIAKRYSECNLTSGIISPFILGVPPSSDLSAHIMYSSHKSNTLLSMAVGEIESDFLSFTLKPIYYLQNKTSRFYDSFYPAMLTRDEFAQFNISDDMRIHNISKQKYDIILSQMNVNDLELPISPTAIDLYDAIYLLAKTLDIYETNHSLRSMCDNGYDFENITAECRHISASIEEFIGVSGPVKVTERGYRIGRMYYYDSNTRRDNNTGRYMPLPPELKPQGLDNVIGSVGSSFVVIWLFSVFLCYKQRSIVRSCMTVGLGLCCFFIISYGFQNLYSYDKWSYDELGTGYRIWLFSNIIILSVAFTLTFPVLVSSNSELMRVLIKKMNEERLGNFNVDVGKKKVWRFLIADAVILPLWSTIFWIFATKNTKIWESSLSSWYINVKTVWCGALLFYKGCQIVYAVDDSIPSFVMYIIIVVCTAFMGLIGLLWFIIDQRLIMPYDMTNEITYIIVAALIIYVYIAWIIQEYFTLLKEVYSNSRWSKQVREPSQSRVTDATQPETATISTKYSHNVSKEINAIISNDIKEEKYETEPTTDIDDNKHLVNGNDVVKSNLNQVVPILEMTATDNSDIVNTVYQD